MVAATAAEISSSTGAADSDTVVANHGDTTAVPEDIVDLAAAVQQALHQQQHTSSAAVSASALPPAPQALPLGWFLKEARSQPGCYYYFNMDTGVSSWASPIVTVVESDNAPQPADEESWRDEENNNVEVDHHEAAPFLEGAANVSPTDTKDDPLQNWSSTSTADVSISTKKRTRNNDEDRLHDKAEPPPSKQRLPDNNNDPPKQVRVLHILRKHKDSRRPSSWRQPVITATREQAVQDLRGLQELLSEVQGDPAELRATLEELARTESDCSSAKRGGDLGFFGPKKMQPAFEDAAFALKVGEMSDIVETASGMHLILRIG